jgi:outer membrane protein OmpA-like peptidoglycan-associated protein
MRRAISAISFMLFGASILIFILALLMPLLRESTPPREGNSKTDVYELSGSLKKIIEKLALKQVQGPVVINKLESSITQLEGKVKQNQTIGLSASIQLGDAAGLTSLVAPNKNAIDRKREDSSPLQSLQTSPETAIPRIYEKSPEPVNPMGAEEKRSPQHKPLSLLVLGAGLFPVGEESPKANMQEAIDKIIPLIKARPLDKVVIEGHADKWIPDGASAVRVSYFNKIVSLQRAKAVAKALEQKGIASDRIIVRGLGDSIPLASNKTNVGRAKNRRVEIKLLPTQ